MEKTAWVIVACGGMLIAVFAACFVLALRFLTKLYSAERYDD